MKQDASILPFKGKGNRLMLDNTLVISLQGLNEPLFSGKLRDVSLFRKLLDLVAELQAQKNTGRLV